MKTAKFVLAAAALAATTTPSFALKFWCDAPEIDAAAGPAALALLTAIGFVAYSRSKR